jgi:hypothetical protein
LIFSAICGIIVWVVDDIVRECIGDARDATSPSRRFTTVYVDDIFVALPRAGHEHAVAKVLAFFEHAAIPIDHAKTQLACRAEWIGFLWCMETMRLYIEPTKRDDLVARIRGVMADGSITREYAQTLVGKLSFSLAASPPSRCFLTRLYRQIHRDSDPRRNIKITAPLRADLDMLLDIITSGEGRVEIRALPEIVIFSDAALEAGPPASGHGGFFVLRRGFKTVWYGHADIPKAVCDVADADAAEKVSSTLFECVAVGIALQTMVDELGWRGADVAIVCDNLAFVQSTAKGRAHSPATNRALCTLLITARRADLRIFPLHMPRELGPVVLADSLSRQNDADLKAAFPHHAHVQLPTHPERFKLWER